MNAIPVIYLSNKSKLNNENELLCNLSTLNDASIFCCVDFVNKFATRNNFNYSIYKLFIASFTR